eukprot:Platyproteum_vivax@DN8746_c0_g1_i1.p1
MDAAARDRSLRSIKDYLHLPGIFTTCKTPSNYGRTRWTLEEAATHCTDDDDCTFVVATPDDVVNCRDYSYTNGTFRTDASIYVKPSSCEHSDRTIDHMINE